MIRLAASLLLLASPALRSSELDLAASNSGTVPVDQLAISGNACGPAALLNALSFGNARWQSVAAAIPGETNRSRMSYVIRAYGLHPSKHVDNRLRWDRKFGMNLLDLRDIGNELCGSRILPELRHEVLVRSGRESDRGLLRRTHAHLAKSLKRGLPPIVSLRRVARPMTVPEGSAPSWRIVHGHFVVVTGIPSKLDREAVSFPFRYVDPWGGRILEGRIRIEPRSGFPSLLANAPSSQVGQAKLRSGETSILSLAAAVGAF